jgi:HSP20 family protein
MALIRWEPVREINSLQNEMNRLFNTFFDSPAPAHGAPTAQRRWVPAMDLIETPDDFVLRADLPGLDTGDVNIELDDNVLTISGEREATHESQKEGYYRVERAWGAFSRSLTLPEGVDAEAVAASFDRGVLEVRVPKPEQRKPRKVSISVDGAPATIDAGEAAASGASGGQASEPNGSTPELAATA